MTLGKTLLSDGPRFLMWKMTIVYSVLSSEIQWLSKILKGIHFSIQLLSIKKKILLHCLKASIFHILERHDLPSCSKEHRPQRGTQPMRMEATSIDWLGRGQSLWVSYRSFIPRFLWIYTCNYISATRKYTYKSSFGWWGWSGWGRTTNWSGKCLNLVNLENHSQLTLKPWATHNSYFVLWLMGCQRKPWSNKSNQGDWVSQGWERVLAGCGSDWELFISGLRFFSKQSFKLLILSFISS